ncbi:hypothetical protein BH11BAC2_BH11BAC2_26330 [soil metagenome]
MKLLFNLALILLCSITTQAQTITNDRFVVIEVRNFSEGKILPLLQQQTAEYAQVRIVGYCNNQNLVAFKLNRFQYPDDKILDLIFKDLGLIIYIKDEIEESQMTDICHQNYNSISN